ERDDDQHDDPGGAHGVLLRFWPGGRALSYPGSPSRPIRNGRTRRGRGGAQAESSKGGAVLEELKNFLFRGNIIELAVAFVMGIAFAAVVNSLVDHLVMPVIAMVIGKADFRGLPFM